MDGAPYGNCAVVSKPRSRIVSNLLSILVGPSQYVLSRYSRETCPKSKDEHTTGESHFGARLTSHRERLTRITRSMIVTEWENRTRIIRDPNDGFPRGRSGGKKVSTTSKRR